MQQTGRTPPQFESLEHLSCVLHPHDPPVQLLEFGAPTDVQQLCGPLGGGTSPEHGMLLGQRPILLAGTAGQSRFCRPPPALTSQPLSSLGSWHGCPPHCPPAASPVFSSRPPAL